MIASQLLRAFLLAVLPVAAMAADADIAIVVNKANPVDSISKIQLRKLLLGEQEKWAGGAKVSVLLRSAGPERDSVIRVACAMSGLEFEQHFVHANLNGDTVSSPKSLASAIAVRQLVASVPGAIGFVHMSEVNDSVKVIKLDGAAPGDPGYKLKAAN
jgi:ABC-type phosphate transport system substrate-binding protein